MDAHSILPLDHTVQDPAQGLNLMDVPHEFFQQESAPQDVERRTRVVLVRLLDTKAPSHPAGQSEQLQVALRASGTYTHACGVHLNPIPQAKFRLPLHNLRMPSKTPSQWHSLASWSLSASTPYCGTAIRWVSDPIIVTSHRLGVLTAQHDTAPNDTRGWRPLPTRSVIHLRHARPVQLQALKQLIEEGCKKARPCSSTPFLRYLSSHIRAYGSSHCYY